MEPNNHQSDGLQVPQGGGGSASITQTKTLLSEDTPERKYNLVRIPTAEEVPLEPDWSALVYKIAIAGYSAAPEGYEVPTQLFLNALVGTLGGGSKVGLITSPTADKGSIDAIGTIASHALSIPLKYITAENYVGYINPDNFPQEGISHEKYNAKPKYVFPTIEEYSRASSVVSNSFLATGGRDATVGDFVNAIKAGNKVIILDNKLLKASVWDEKKNRPNNASAYLAQKLAGETSLPLIPSKDFTQEFLDRNAEAISSLVKVITITSCDDVPKAVEEAVKFLKS